MAGDFNARTASASGTCMEDFSDLLDTSLQPDGQLCEHLKSRTSDDQHTCAFGKTLLDLCEVQASELRGCNIGALLTANEIPSLSQGSGLGRGLEAVLAAVETGTEAAWAGGC